MNQLSMINRAKSTLLKKGYLDIPIESASKTEDILQLKEHNNAVILAHYYQESAIQDIADFVGDSLELSRKAKETEADIIVFCGVHFMAETAKIVNPQKKVLLPDLNAGCSLSDSCPPDAFATFKKSHPDAITISYINCSADIKAQSDIICTSSNATLIVNSVPKNKEIIFAPDKNLGRYVEQQTGRKLILWDGACVVHEEFSLKKSQELLALNPDAKFISHPEAIQEVLEVADFVGSTSQLLKFVQNDTSQKYVVATENGIFHQMKKAVPKKVFITAACNNCIKTCVCGECDYMKMNTLEKVYLCLKYELPEITVEEKVRQLAEKSLNRMIELSQSIK